MKLDRRRRDDFGNCSGVELCLCFGFEEERTYSKTRSTSARMRNLWTQRARGYYATMAILRVLGRDVEGQSALVISML
jgi:saccharopine dehydrogenase-like NADP-dependent oxidoreductase